MSVATEIVIVLLLVLANGVFAGAEIAVISTRKSRIKELAAEGRASGRALLAMREDPERFLATVQIGITVIGATAAAFGGATLAAALRPVLERVGLGSHAPDAALATVVVGISYLSLVLGELVPKSLALRSSERYAVLVARPLRLLSRLVRPLVWLLTASSNVILRVFGDRTSFVESRLTRDEVEQLVGEAATVGAVDPREGDIAARALHMAELQVGAIMLPRGDVALLRRDASVEDIRAFIARSPQVRVAVRGDGDNDVLGYVTWRDLIQALSAEEPRPLANILRRPAFVPESARVLDVMREMQRSQVHIAVVLEPDGSLAGLLTLEDILEELVGEIFSEHERAVMKIVREGPDRTLVRGKVPVHEVNRELGLDLPESREWRTVAGLVVAKVGAIPPVGVRVTVAKCELEVVEATERRVVAVRIVHPGGEGRR